MRINSNISAFGAQSNLRRTSQAIARALERLSSGKRVNSPKDDSASFATGVRLESQIRGLRQSNLNIQSTQSLLTTAESAVSTQLDLVMRMREIALQGANGSLSGTERANLNSELKSLLREFERITQSTEFNGRKLLDGSSASVSVQPGAFAGESLNVDLLDHSLEELFRKSIGTGSFKTPTNYTVGVPYTGAIVSGDLDNDGDEDIVSGRADGFAVSMGAGNGKFYRRQIIGDGLNADTYVKLGDLNNDGYLDIVGTDTDFGGNRLVYFLNNGDGTFGSRTVIFDVNSLRFDLGDFDKDGNLDLAMLNGANVEVHLGNGDATFNTPTTYALSGNGTDVALGDMNNDGKLDIVTTDAAIHASVFLGIGDGTFATRTTQMSGAAAAVRLRLGDMNRDGKLDVLALQSNTWLLTLLGNGDGSLQTRLTHNFVSVSNDFNIGDLNGDGVLDVISMSNSIAAWVLRAFGKGDGSYQTTMTYDLSTFGTGSVLADLNNDGALDFTYLTTGGNLSVLLGYSKSVSALTDLNVDDSQNSAELLEILDSAIISLQSNQADIASIHSRLDFRSSSNLLLNDVLEEARSKTLEADLALETAELVRNQILQQAQVAVRAQENLQMQMILKLLG